jgi:hypothetical protein
LELTISNHPLHLEKPTQTISENTKENVSSWNLLSPTIHFTLKNQLKPSQLSKKHLTPSQFISLHPAEHTDVVDS